MSRLLPFSTHSLAIFFIILLCTIIYHSLNFFFLCVVLLPIPPKHETQFASNFHNFTSFFLLLCLSVRGLHVFSSARARSLEHECYQLIVTINLYVPTIIIIFIMLSTFIVCRFFVCFRVFFGSEGERERERCVLRSRFSNDNYN